jgi:maltose O-acetyltransferase
MRRTVTGWLKRFRPFRVLSWISESYAREQVDYRRLFKRCGENVTVSGRACISNCDMISVGSNVFIQDGVLINGEGGLSIGDNVGISYRAIIWTVEHRYTDSGAIPFDAAVLLKPVRINDNVWVGAGVSITSGVEIGEGAVIGIGSVVVRDVPPLAIALGNPAKIIGYRDREHYDRCKAAGRFVDFRAAGERIVPPYIQVRPRLFEIVEERVRSGGAVLGRNPGDDGR